MQVKFLVKQLGKKHPVMAERTVDLPLAGPVLPLRELIEALVYDQVTAYNSRDTDNADEDSPLPLEASFPLVSPGKVGFNKIYNGNKADVHRALDNALQAFEDGLYLVLYGDQEVKSLGEKVDISEGKMFSFVRLVFLTGGYF